MPVPSAISDLSTTPGLNSPSGSESPASIDDYLRTHAAFIKQVSDASVKTSGDQTIAGTKTFSSPIAGSITGNAATATAANTIALTNDGTTNAAHYLTFSDGTAGQEALKTDTAKLAYNPSTGLLSANISAASLTSGSVPDARLTQVIGVGQTWQNVAGSRSLGVFYTNSTGRPIVATVTIAAAATVGVQYFIGGTQFAATNVLSNLPQTFTFIVPNGVTYRVDTTSTILYWWELR